MLQALAFPPPCRLSRTVFWDGLVLRADAAGARLRGFWCRPGDAERGSDGASRAGPGPGQRRRPVAPSNRCVRPGWGAMRMVSPGFSEMRSRNRQEIS